MNWLYVDPVLSPEVGMFAVYVLEGRGWGKYIVYIYEAWEEVTWVGWIWWVVVLVVSEEQLMR